MKTPRACWLRQGAKLEIAWLPFCQLVGLAAGLLAAPALAQSDYAPPYTITTLAGSLPGGTDGTGTGARFSRPGGTAASQSATSIMTASST